jgi:hypothetical protein
MSHHESSSGFVEFVHDASSRTEIDLKRLIRVRNRHYAIFFTTEKDVLAMLIAPEILHHAPSLSSAQSVATTFCSIAFIAI